MPIDVQMIREITDSFERTRPLCPDHRDKQEGSGCLACRIEMLINSIKKMKKHATRELPEHQADLGNRLQVMLSMAEEALRKDEYVRKNGRR